MKRALFVVAFLMLGCGPQIAEPVPAASATATSSSGSEQPLVAPGEARVGDRTTCIVSKEEFVVGEESAHADYKGRTYYFCCAGCAAKFQADPEKYLGG